MTSAELGLICGAIASGLGGIGAVVRWSATRISNAIETGNKERHDVIDRNTDALIAVSATMARMEGLVTAARDASIKTEEAVEKVADEVTSNHELIPVELLEEDGEQLRLEQPPPFAKTKTPPGGYTIIKSKGTRS